MRLNLFIIFLSLSACAFGQSNTDMARQLPYTLQNITFESAGTALAGTIFLPERPKSAIVLIHGSGQEKRMVKLGADLAARGFAVLTYDKRGVGESGGVYAGPEAGTNNIDTTNLNLLAADAAAACKFLAAHLTRKRTAIGLMGASQAGWVIPLAATKTPLVKFMVIFSGPVVTTLAQLRFQFYTNGNTAFWDSHSEAEALEHIKNDPDRYKFEAFDPNPALLKLNIPALWVFGGKDIQVPVSLSINNLKTLQATGKKFEYVLFPELGHNTLFSKSTEPLSTAEHWMRGHFK
ncbi:alpha/beta hydrolase family protein [Pedobacter aquatilis]|uniref:alpha/beta hydrolase family protein n=1 Tax=Pedobacter aquatilis TaxID=351343 RepID=UPI00292CACD6|nr:alpha/beta fold hydrolase [Pedobacter aquatilis]